MQNHMQEVDGPIDLRSKAHMESVLTANFAEMNQSHLYVPKQQQQSQSVTKVSRQSVHPNYSLNSSAARPQLMIKREKFYGQEVYFDK